MIPTFCPEGEERFECKAQIKNRNAVYIGVHKFLVFIQQRNNRTFIRPLVEGIIL